MLRRLIVILVLIPSVALAADGDQLGPTTGNDPNQGPSRDVSQLLQPASPTTSQSLQSADAVEGGIPQVKSSNDLQSAGNQAQFKDFAGVDANAERQQLPSSSSNDSGRWWPVGIVVGFALLMWLEEEYKLLGHVAKQAKKAYAKTA